METIGKVPVASCNIFMGLGRRASKESDIVHGSGA